MGRNNGYRYKAIKTLVGGIWYDSHLEGRMARLLIANGVKFTPHVTFDCFDPKGRPFQYAVDFVFEVPQKFAGVSFTLDCLEVKGVISRNSIIRNEAIKYCHNMRCWCVGYEMIDFWEREGIYWPKEDK